jgi:hypothetical protein
LTKFVIKGDVQEACATLKAPLDAQDSNFKASMNSMFKPAPPPHRADGAAGKPRAGNPGFVLGKTPSDRFGR